MSLRVQRQRLAILGQMDGQLRHPQDRIVNPDKTMGGSAAITTDSLPLIPRSRSSQELSHAPPYGSSATTRHPPTTRSGCCLTRRLGLSVCAPTIRNGSAGPVMDPAAFQATSEPARMVK